MVIALALVVSAIFGGADQYLGSLSAHPWGAQVSLLSAPWLVLPFIAGCTQQQPKRAALLGLACTAAALAGYGLMTLSPIENAHISVATISGFARSEREVLVGGIVTGPLFGWFGQQWQVRRAWVGAAITALAICFEPAVRKLAGQPITNRTVWLSEIAAGVLATGYVLLAALRRPTKRAAMSMGPT